MRKITSAVLIVAVGFLMQSALRAQLGEPAPQAAKDAAVPVKAVVLFSSGVGYFEHAGKVSGDASAELRFKTNQINDILKSLILQDMDNGKVNTVTYPSQDPLSKTLRSFQIDITHNPSLAELLNQIRGAKISLTIQTEKVAGTVLGVEKKQKPAGDRGVVDYWVLNVISGGTIRALSLDDVRDLQLEDPQLQAELHKALAALAQARDQDKKPVVINFLGKGERRVRIGYVIETPIWKTSYRLILQDKPALQGWAIVENQTDNDWNNVQLSLVSGRPISFVQDLYRPLYIPRPVVMPELYASLRPQTYEGGLAQEKSEMAQFAPPAPMAAARAPRAKRGGGVGGMVGYSGAANEEMAMADAAMAPMEATASVSSVASASKVGELFQYTVGNVTLPRQRSAMIPIITDPIEVEKLSIYNQGVLPRNPLNGARVKNTTGKHLLAGPVTVLDDHSYAGDASIDNLPPGQERLLSYGIDLQVRVDATKNSQNSSLVSGRIVKGVLYIQHKNVMTQEYLSENKGVKDKTLIIEHPIQQGWKLVDTIKPIETTEVLYRFKGQAPAGKTSKLIVTEELIHSEQMAILPCDVGQIQFYARNGAIPGEVRSALEKAAALKQAMVDTQRQIAQRQRELSQITQDQNRLRENMRTVAQNSNIYNRLLKKLDDQENQVEKLQGEASGLQGKLESQRKELEDYLMKLNVG